MLGLAIVVGVVWFWIRRHRASAMTDERDTHVNGETLVTRSEVFARSYEEVLSALKHQDDKLNRTLTAIAFLTAAGVALFARAANSELSFDESGTSIPAVLFVVFLGSTVLALALALVAIGPSTAFPFLGSEEARRRRRESYVPRERSLIFYLSINRDPHWDEYIDRDAKALQEQLTRNYHREARVIARRVEYKVARSRESGAFVQLTVLSLALLGIFSIGQFSLDVRWWLAAGLVLALLALPFVDLVHMNWFKFEERPTAWAGYVLLGISLVSAAILLTVSPWADTHWPALYYALIAVACSRLGVVHEWSGRIFLGGAAVGGVTLIAILAITVR